MADDNTTYVTIIGVHGTVLPNGCPGLILEIEDGKRIGFQLSPSTSVGFRRALAEAEMPGVREPHAS